MIIIADRPRPHKRFFKMGFGGGGGGVGGAPKPARGGFSGASARSGGSAAGGCAPISAPFAHPPGGTASSRKPAKKAGQGRDSLSRRGSPAESPGIGPQARWRLRRRRRRQSLRAPAAPGWPAALPLPYPYLSPPPPHKPPPATIKFSPTRRPHPAKSLRTPAKKRRPHRDGALLTFFRFSPAWQGRHGCGRGSPHGPAPPPALCRRRG